MKRTRRLVPLMVLGIITIASVKTFAAVSPNFTLPPLPYAEDALDPYISKNTLFYHYTKHHLGYAQKLNDMAKTHNLIGLSLEEMIKKTYNNPELTSVFNAAAQTWNHSFYWASMKKNGGGLPAGAIKDLIDKTFGSFEAFKKQFMEAGTNLLGSGWVWLVQDKDKTLRIVATGNADLPLVHDQTPLLTCDIWEHAYYLDYQNRRRDYVEVFLDHLVNWDFANQNLS